MLEEDFFIKIAEIFVLLLSICLSLDFNIEQSSAKLYELFKT